jgi:hypothetical protein
MSAGNFLGVFAGHQGKENEFYEVEELGEIDNLYGSLLRLFFF